MALFRKAHAGNIYILDCVASEEVLIERKVARRRRFRHGGEQISASRGKPSGLEAYRSESGSGISDVGRDRRRCRDPNCPPGGGSTSAELQGSIRRRAALMRLTSVIGSASLCLPHADLGTVLVLTRPPDQVLLRPPPVIRASDGDQRRCGPSPLRSAIGGLVSALSGAAVLVNVAS